MKKKLSEKQKVELHQTMELDMQSGECAIIDDSKPKSPTQIRIGNNILGYIGINQKFSSTEEAITAINTKMDQDQWWTNIYHINDHGNITLLNNKRKRNNKLGINF